MRKTHAPIELLGAIAIPNAQYRCSRYSQEKIQSEFEQLRDSSETGDWFLPGISLLMFIQEHARPHFCSRSCSGGTTVYEEMRADDLTASVAIQKAFQSD